jgi:hypothetical protein
VELDPKSAAARDHLAKANQAAAPAPKP